MERGKEESSGVFDRDRRVDEQAVLATGVVEVALQSGTFQDQAAYRRLQRSDRFILLADVRSQYLCVTNTN